MRCIKESYRDNLGRPRIEYRVYFDVVELTEVIDFLQKEVDEK